MNSVKQHFQNDLNFITIKHKGFKVILCDLGASLYQIYFDDVPMTVQSSDINEFKSKTNHNGKTIGRFAGRIANGKIVVDENNSYTVPTNENGNTLHGGIDGFSTKIFKLRSIDNRLDKTIVMYQYLSQDNDSGFRGNMLITVTYEIPHDDEWVKICFTTMCDRACPSNITNHTYFNLGEQNLNDLTLQVNAHKYVYLRDKDLLPLEIRKMPECLNFNEPKHIMQDINNPEINYGVIKGYDHYFIFDQIDEENPQVTLQNKLYRLYAFTNYPGAMIFSDNYREQNPHRGLTIETQFNPMNSCIIQPHTQNDYFVKFVFRKNKLKS